MSDPRYLSTDFLVFRKTPYSDTSLIVAGVTPDYGQMHFIIRGARRIGKRRFPVVDLFRELAVQYRPGRNELHMWRSGDMLRDFSAVAQDMGTFNTAGWLARFALANMLPEVAHPRFYQALTLSLARLAAAAPVAARERPDKLCRALVVGTSLVYLEENGLLPDYAADPRAANQCRQLLAMVQGEGDVPRLTAETWEKLRAWTVTLLRQAECSVPA